MPEITYGRWNPSEIRDRIMDDTWTGVEVVSGIEKVLPTSIDFSGESASLDISTGVVSFRNVSFVRVNGLFSSTYVLYKMLTNISCNVFDGTWLRAKISFGAGTDDTIGSSYEWVYKYIAAATVSGSASSSNTSWALSYLFQQSFEDEILISKPIGSATVGFYRKGLYDDNVRDDFTYAQWDQAGFTTTNANPTSLYLFPANNLEFMTGTLAFYGYK